MSENKEQVKCEINNSDTGICTEARGARGNAFVFLYNQKSSTPLIILSLLFSYL